MEQFFREVTSRVFNEYSSNNRSGAFDYIQQRIGPLESILLTCFRDNINPQYFDGIRHSMDDVCKAVYAQVENIFRNLNNSQREIQQLSDENLDDAIFRMFEDLARLLNSKIEERGRNNNNNGNQWHGNNGNQHSVNHKVSNNRQYGSNGGSVWGNPGNTSGRASRAGGNNEPSIDSATEAPQQRQNIQQNNVTWKDQSEYKMVQQSEVFPEREKRKSLIEETPIKGEVKEIVVDPEKWLNEKAINLMKAEASLDPGAEWMTGGVIDIARSISNNDSGPFNQTIRNIVRTVPIRLERSNRAPIALAQEKSFTGLIDKINQTLTVESPLACYINTFITNGFHKNMSNIGLDDIIAGDIVFLEDCHDIEKMADDHSPACIQRFRDFENMTLGRLFMDIKVVSDIHTFVGFEDQVTDGDLKGYTPMPVKIRYILTSCLSSMIPTGSINKLTHPLFHEFAETINTDKGNVIIMSIDMVQFLIERKPKSVQEDASFRCTNIGLLM